MKISDAWGLIKESVTAWIDDYAPSMGAALAYYTVFSLAPLLLIVIAVAGFVFGQDAVRGEIVAQLGGLLGEEGANGVQALLKSADEPREGLISSIVGVVLLLIGATTVFAELQSSLDRIWRVPARKGESGLWALLRQRILSFGMVLGLGFMLLVSLVVGAALAAFGTWWGSLVGGWEIVLQIVNLAVSLALSTALFAMIYKLMPRAKIAWHDVWIGAVVTAVLFETGKFLIGLYLGKSGIASGFGAAGSIVLLLVWVYYSAQIFLLGAEFTWVYAQKHGSRVASPVKGAADPVDARAGDPVEIWEGERAPTPVFVSRSSRRPAGKTEASWIGRAVKLVAAGGTAIALGALFGRLTSR